MWEMTASRLVREEVHGHWCKSVCGGSVEVQTILVARKISRTQVVLCTTKVAEYHLHLTSVMPMTSVEDVLGMFFVVAEAC
jgi:hypothetical protein